jgi:hypothetical protein
MGVSTLEDWRQEALADAHASQDFDQAAQVTGSWVGSASFVELGIDDHDRDVTA